MTIPTDPFDSVHHGAHRNRRAKRRDGGKARRRPMGRPRGNGTVTEGGCTKHGLHMAEHPKRRGAFSAHGGSSANRVTPFLKRGGRQNTNQKGTGG